MSDVFYAAYGSNMSTKQMDSRCQYSKLVDVGFVPNHRLVFASYASRWNGAVADVEVSDDDEVPVLVYRLSEGDLAKLDGFEGYPSKYTRKQVFVQGRKGKMFKCWIYVLASKHAGKYGNPSDEYFGQICRAYVRFKIDLKNAIRQREFSSLNQVAFPTTDFDDFTNW